jgi:hypothetical protein
MASLFQPFHEVQNRADWRSSWTEARLTGLYWRLAETHRDGCAVPLRLVPVRDDMRSGTAQMPPPTHAPLTVGASADAGDVPFAPVLRGPGGLVLPPLGVLFINLDDHEDEAALEAALLLEMVTRDRHQDQREREFFEEIERHLGNGFKLKLDSSHIEGFRFRDFVPPEFVRCRAALEQVFQEGDSDPPVTEQDIHERFHEMARLHGGDWEYALYFFGPGVRLANCFGERVPGKSRELEIAARAFTRGLASFSLMIEHVTMVRWSEEAHWRHRDLRDFVGDLGIEEMDHGACTAPVAASSGTTWRVLSTLSEGHLANVLLAFRKALVGHGIRVPYRLLAQTARTVPGDIPMGTLPPSHRSLPSSFGSTAIRPTDTRLWSPLDYALCQHLLPLLPDPIEARAETAELYRELFELAANPLKFGPEHGPTAVPLTLPRTAAAIFRRHTELAQVLGERLRKASEGSELACAEAKKRPRALRVVR